MKTLLTYPSTQKVPQLVTRKALPKKPLHVQNSNATLSADILPALEPATKKTGVALDMTVHMQAWYHSN